MEQRGKCKASKRPYMKLFTSDYRDGTAQLSFEVQGFYIRILTYLNDGDTVPSDPSQLARFLQCNTRTVRKLLPPLLAAGKLFEDGLALKNPRIERELDANSTAIHAELDANSSAKIQKDESNQEGSEHYYGVSHCHSHSHSQKEDKTTIQPEAVREAEGRQNLKSIFNGSTDAMLSDVLAWMGPLARMDEATKWLTGTLSAYGAERTAQAWTIITAKQASGQVVGNPLALWSKTAGGIKAEKSEPKQHPKTVAANAARASLDRMLEATP